MGAAVCLGYAAKAAFSVLRQGRRRLGLGNPWRTQADTPDFGFLSFIHQLRFKRLLAAGKAPRDLTMAMLANTLRFACDPTPENLARSDQLIDTVIHTLVPKALQGFGAVQLMVSASSASRLTLLDHHPDPHVRGQPQQLCVVVDPDGHFGAHDADDVPADLRPHVS